MSKSEVESKIKETINNTDVKIIEYDKFQKKKESIRIKKILAHYNLLDDDEEED